MWCWRIQLRGQETGRLMGGGELASGGREILRYGEESGVI